MLQIPSALAMIGLAIWCFASGRGMVGIATLVSMYPGPIGFIIKLVLIIFVFAPLASDGTWGPVVIVSIALVWDLLALAITAIFMAGNSES